MKYLLWPILLTLAATIVGQGAAQTTPDRDAPIWSETWPLEARHVPFDDESPIDPVLYHPLSQAEKPWQICVLYPHLKDAYWLSVNYGMVQEARRLGVGFVLHEAGGYPNLDRQIDQVRLCRQSGADALVVGTVSLEGLSAEISQIAARMPVIAAVNDISDIGITAKSSVAWYDMGEAAGRVIAARHPKGSPPVRLAWFPGPVGGGWVGFVQAGFRDALAQSSAQIVVTKFGDTGREEQVLLVEEALDEIPDLDYLVGSGPMAEAAVSILRGRGLDTRTQIVSTYLTHAVYRGIKRGKILAAPTDFPIYQGRLAVELAVRALEGRLTLRHAGPRIITITQDNIAQIGAEGSLAPASFSAVFEVK